MNCSAMADCVLSVLAMIVWYSASAVGTFTSKVTVGWVSRSLRLMMHSTGTARLRFMSPPPDETLVPMSGCSEVLSL